MSSLRDLLNRAHWRDAQLHALEIHVLHRGAPRDRRVIPGSRISGVRSAGVELSPETEGGDMVFVPYHRFLAIYGPDGDELWSKDARAKPEPPAQVDIVQDVTGTEVSTEIALVLHEATDEQPIVLDGSAGEGGGQILRTSLALSMATGTPFVLENIRARRKKPGLKRQHLTCVQAAALVCGGVVEGASLGSTRIVFRPGPIVAGDQVIDIGSAGSVTLVLQTIALPLTLASAASRITVRGGTHASLAPPYPFLEQAWLPLVRRMGARIALDLISSGFYPAGGGEVVMTVDPSQALASLHVGEPVVLSTLRLRAIVSNLPEEIARREIAAATELLTDLSVEAATESVPSPGKGNAIWLVARDEATSVANVFAAIGELGVRAEEIGHAVARSFLAWRESGASVEAHLADQLMLPIALAGEGSFTCNELTLHARTNIEVIRVFTGHRLRAWDLGDGRFRVALILPGEKHS
jgi:RNA 3'-terminal phosphate cyclase (ATP)